MNLRLLVVLIAASCQSDKRAEPQKAPPPARDAAAPDPCAVSILIDDAGLWIATRAGSCHARRVDGQLDYAWAEAELRTLKAAMTECSAAELASASGPYQDLIHVMDGAVKAGFIDVGLTERHSLSLQIAASGKDTIHCTPPAPPRPAPKQPIAAVPTITAPPIKQIEIPVPELPVNNSQSELQKAPVIVVTKTELMYQGHVVVTVDKILHSDTAMIPELRTQLEATGAESAKELAAGAGGTALRDACNDAKRGIRPKPGAVCPMGLAILQADEDTDVRVINAIVSTAKAAGFDNLLFAVKNR